MKRSFKAITLASTFIGMMAVVQTASAQQTNFFVEGTGGFGKADLGSTSGVSVDERDTNWGLAVGYMFNNYVGIEAGYRDLGSVDAKASGTISGNYYGTAYTATGTFNAKGSADGWMYGARFNLPINNMSSVQFRAGWLDWDGDLKASATGSLTFGGTTYAGNVQAKGSDSGTDMYWGIAGLGNINKQLAVGVGYTRFKLDSVDIDSVDLNLHYRF